MKIRHQCSTAWRSSRNHALPQRSHDTPVVTVNEMRMRGPSGYTIRVLMRCYHRSVVAPYRTWQRGIFLANRLAKFYSVSVRPLVYSSFLLSLVLYPANGQEDDTPDPPEATQPAKPAPDFSAAFAMLRSLGLPSVKDAGLRWEPMLSFQSKGPAGILACYQWEKKPPSGGRSLVVGQTLEVATKQNAHESAALRAAMPDLGEYDDWHELGADQYAWEILAQLALPVPKENPREEPSKTEREVAAELIEDIRQPTRYAYDDDEVAQTLNGLGRVLLFATHLDERGHREEAIRLAEAAFGTPIGPEPVISTAITLIAETAYAKAFHGFLHHGDMKTWKSDLEAILAKFPRGYANTAAVKLALADGTAALAPKPLGIPEAEALAKTWRATRLEQNITKHVEDALLVSNGNLPTPWFYYTWNEPDADTPRCPPVPWLIDAELAKAPDPLGQLLAQGPRALPILLALAADGSATPNATSLVGFGPDSSNRFDSPTADQKAQSNYLDHMPRPAKVGEIATSLLASLLTEEKGTWSRLRPDEITGRVDTWLGSLPDRTPGGLAMHYLEAGNQVQKSGALRALLSKPDAARLEKIEGLLIAARPRANFLPVVEEYLAIRGSDASDFFALFRMVVDEELKNANLTHFEEDWFVHAESIAEAKARVVAQFDPLGGLVDLEKLLETISNTETGSSVKYRPVLKSSLAKLKPEDSVSRWLAAVVNARDPAARGNLLDESTVAALPPVPMAPNQWEQWRTLLSDDRVGSDPFLMVSLVMPAPRVSELALLAWKTLHGSTVDFDSGKAQTLCQVMDEASFVELSISRAKARAEGSLLPPWPDEEKLTVPERDALFARLNGLPPAEFAPAIKALGLKEKIALLSLKQPYDSSGQACRIVHEVNLDGTSEKALAFTREWKGRVLTPTMVQQLIAALLEPGGDSYTVTLLPDQLIPGLRLEVHPVPSSRRPEASYWGSKCALAARLRSNPMANGSAEAIADGALFSREKDQQDNSFHNAEQVRKFNDAVTRALVPEAVHPVLLQFFFQRMVP